VWKAIGTDTVFLAWLRTQPCVLDGSKADPCSGDVVAAHVRRIANGAGAGIKPPYSAIPLCHHHHSLQHQHGESRLAPKEQWDEWRVWYLEQWGWETLKGFMGEESMGDVPPERLKAWAVLKGVERYLPPAYL
jgi:hypothetical protein